jgi:hypothetical protein
VRNTNDKARRRFAIGGLTYEFRTKPPVAFLWVQRTKNAGFDTLHSKSMLTF